MGWWGLLLWCLLTHATMHWWVLVPCAVQWAWALKNVAVGPLKKDAGVVSFLPGLVCGAVEAYLGQASVGVQIGMASGFFLVFLNFFYACYLMWKGFQAADSIEVFQTNIMKRMDKSR